MLAYLRDRSDQTTCCHTETDVVDQTCNLTQSRCTDTGPDGPNTDCITPGAWPGSHCKTSFYFTGITRAGQKAPLGNHDHNRLNHHLYSKLRIGHTQQCPCGTGSPTTQHLLQSCPIYEPLRKGVWPDHTPVACKLYGSLRNLHCTATFIEETGVSIRRTSLFCFVCWLLNVPATC